jgi:peptidoglycan hydrolase CwlO-like protein
MTTSRPQRRAALATIASTGGLLAVLAAGVVAAPETASLTAQQTTVRELESQIIALDAQANAAADEHASALSRLDEARDAVKTNTEGLKEARRNRALALESLEQRLVALYRSSAPSMAEIVLTSGGLTETLDQIELLNRASEQDQKVFRSVVQTRQRLVESRSELLRLRKVAVSEERTAGEKNAAISRLLSERRGVLTSARATLAASQAAQAQRIAVASRQAEQTIRSRAGIASPQGSQVAEGPDRPPMSQHLQQIAQCESGGNPRAVSPSGLYRGKYQFHPDTWRAVGGTGDPAAASEAEQDRRAAILYERQGPSPWPICGS